MKGLLIFTVAIVTLGTFAANASIQISFTRTMGTGGADGFDIVRFFAIIPTGDPAAGSALNSQNVPVSGLRFVDLTMQVSTVSPNGFAYHFQGNPGGFGDIVTDFSNVSNPKSNTAATLGALGTGIRVGTAADFVATAIDPSPSTAAYAVNPNIPGNFVRTGPKPEVAYDLIGVPADDASPDYPNSFDKTFPSTTKSFHVKGSNTENPDASAITDNSASGNGALFAIAVVPMGANVNIFGSIAGVTGPIQQFGTPEPGSITLLVIAGLGLLRRRRRQVA